MNAKNVTILHIWLTENGNSSRELLCKNVGISLATLQRILSGSTKPRFSTRYKIYKLTGVSLCDEDNFHLIKDQAS